MPKSTAITIIVVTLLLIAGGLGWWYYSLGTGTGAGETGSEKDGILNNFFPFGENAEQTRNTESGKTNSENKNAETENAPQVRQISELPVAGFLPLNDNLGFPFVRYVEQETGHVYDAPLQIVSKKRISNTTIPKAREVLWMPNGASFIIRYLDDKDIIQSFHATLKESATSTEDSAKDSEGTLSGKFLPENISAVNLMPSGSAKTSPKIIYMTTSALGISVFTSEQDGAKATKVYLNPLKDWLTFPISDSLAYLLSKSSGKAPSFAFSLNLKNGSVTETLSNIYGLSILPNKKGDLILYSDTNFGEPRLALYDVNKKTISPISLKTFADKCVWSADNATRIICAVPKVFPQGTYPDIWYQGKVSFNDNLWEINATNGETKELINLSGNSFFLDAAYISLSDKDRYVLILDKPTGTLWSVRLKE